MAALEFLSWIPLPWRCKLPALLLDASDLFLQRCDSRVRITSTRRGLVRAVHCQCACTVRPVVPFTVRQLFRQLETTKTQSQCDNTAQKITRQVSNLNKMKNTASQLAVHQPTDAIKTKPWHATGEANKSRHIPRHSTSKPELQHARNENALSHCILRALPYWLQYRLHDTTKTRVAKLNKTQGKGLEVLAKLLRIIQAMSLYKNPDRSFVARPNPSGARSLPLSNNKLSYVNIKHGERTVFKSLHQNQMPSSPCVFGEEEAGSLSKSYEWWQYIKLICLYLPSSAHIGVVKGTGDWSQARSQVGR